MNKTVCFGIDIGGTTIKCGLFSTEGVLLNKQEIPTRKEQAGTFILDDIEAHIRLQLEQRQLSFDQVAGVGIGIPGAVTESGVVNRCVNLGWGMVPIVEEMTKRLGIPVKTGNDANMAALGEYWKGSGEGYSSMMLVTLGTGVGGGIIIDGKPLNGFYGAAAEIGHMPIVEEEMPLCNCGKRGCLEQVTSATGIVWKAKQILTQSMEKSRLRSIENFSAKDIFDAAKQEDKLAVQTVQYVCRYLAKGLACAAGIVDPECFLIGGGVSAAGQYLIDSIQKYYSEYAFHASCDTKILLATLGNDAGMYGAAKLVLS